MEICEIIFVEYTPCLSAPCLHNSTCVVQSEHHFQCICAPSFIGIFCEIGKSIDFVDIRHDFLSFDRNS